MSDNEVAESISQSRLSPDQSVTSPTARQPTKTPIPIPLNGIDTPKMLETIGTLDSQPELAKFTFRASNRWIAGMHSQSLMYGFFGAGGEHRHYAPHRADGDYPMLMCGDDAGPTPLEWILHALAAGLTAGIANIAAARGIRLHRVQSNVEGDIDLLGMLGRGNNVRNGYQTIRMHFQIEGDAPRDQLEDIVRQARERSAVFDIVTNGVPVSVDVKNEQRR